MDISDLRDAPDNAGELAAASLRYVSDISLPDVSLADVSLPDALDINVADLAGDAIELAGDVAGTVVSQGGRGLARLVRAARDNPKAAAGLVAVLVVLVALVASKRTSSESSLESVS